MKRTDREPQLARSAFPVCCRCTRHSLARVPLLLRSAQARGDSSPFSAVPSDGTGHNGHKVKQRKLSLAVVENVFIWREGKPWNRLPGGVLQAPSLEVVKA